MSSHFDGGVDTNESRAALDEDHGRNMLRVHPELAEQSLPGGRLQGGEPDHVVAFVGQDEPNSAGAQIAHSIK